MNELSSSALTNISYGELAPVQQLEVQLDIVGEFIRRRDLARLTEMEIAKAVSLPPLEEDVIQNIRTCLHSIKCDVREYANKK